MTTTQTRKVTRIERQCRLSVGDSVTRATDYFIYAHTGGFEISLHVHQDNAQLSVWNEAIGTFIESRISRDDAARLLRKFRKLAR